MVEGSQQPLNFDLAAGEQAKQEGMEQAAMSRAELLRYAQFVAYALAIRKGEITADDVQEQLSKEGHTLLGNAAGSLFRGDQWEFTGRWRKSKRVSNHAHQNRVWRLKKR